MAGKESGVRADAVFGHRRNGFLALFEATTVIADDNSRDALREVVDVVSEFRVQQFVSRMSMRINHGLGACRNHIVHDDNAITLDANAGDCRRIAGPVVDLAVDNKNVKLGVIVRSGAGLIKQQDCRQRGDQQS